MNSIKICNEFGHVASFFLLFFFWLRFGCKQSGCWLTVADVQFGERLTQESLLSCLSSRVKPKRKQTPTDSRRHDEETPSTAILHEPLRVLFYLPNVLGSKCWSWCRQTAVLKLLYGIFRKNIFFLRSSFLQKRIQAVPREQKSNFDIFSAVQFVVAVLRRTPTLPEPLLYISMNSLRLLKRMNINQLVAKKWDRIPRQRHSGCTAKQRL